MQPSRRIKFKIKNIFDSARRLVQRKVNIWLDTLYLYKSEQKLGIKFQKWCDMIGTNSFGGHILANYTVAEYESKSKFTVNVCVLFGPFLCLYLIWYMIFISTYSLMYIYFRIRMICVYIVDCGVGASTSEEWYINKKNCFCEC